MHDCVVNLWPHLSTQGYVFIDEYIRLDYCALFFSERFWRTYFDRPPPGLHGRRHRDRVGQYFLGPLRPGDRRSRADERCLHPQGLLRPVGLRARTRRRRNVLVAVPLGSCDSDPRV